MAYKDESSYENDPAQQAYEAKLNEEKEKAVATKAKKKKEAQPTTVTNNRLDLANEKREKLGWATEPNIAEPKKTVAEAQEEANERAILKAEEEAQRKLMNDQAKVKAHLDKEIEREELTKQIAEEVYRSGNGLSERMRALLAKWKEWGAPQGKNASGKDEFTTKHAYAKLLKKCLLEWYGEEKKRYVERLMTTVCQCYCDDQPFYIMYRRERKASGSETITNEDGTTTTRKAIQVKKIGDISEAIPDLLDRLHEEGKEVELGDIANAVKMAMEIAKYCKYPVAQQARLSLGSIYATLNQAVKNEA